MTTSKASERASLLQGTLDLLVLRTLLFGPMHGHGIAKAIQKNSEDLLLVDHGSLYPALHRLEVKKWLSAEWQASETGREARVYSLTKVGKKQLALEKESWDRLNAAVKLIFAGNE